MPLPDESLFEITMKMTYLSQQVANVFAYRISGTPGPVTAVDLAEGWWNHVKSTYRAMIPASSGNTFNSVLLREINNPVGDYAEFPVPTAEQPGTRSAAGLTAQVPSFCAVGVRLSVGSRATRPGQKRVPFLFEEDVNIQAVGATFLALVENWADVISVQMVLGAPVALTQIEPIVVRYDANDDYVTSQDIVGYVINPNVTTQVSRKLGRGT